MRLMRFTPLLALLALSSCGKLNPTTAPTTGAEVAPAEAQDLARSRPDPGSAGAVYTLTNDAGGNAVLAFARRADGGLAPPTMHPTGGRGAGVGLGNQNAVILSDEDDLLFAVNAGSNDISVMKLTHRGPVLHDRTPSGGERPISLAMHGKLLYVLNAGGPGNITGFRVGGQGRLKPIPSSTRPLGSVAAGPAQIGFSPDGNHLVVTEKATHTISVYEVAHGGRAFGPRVQPSHGQTPFGFAFDRRGDLVVSEAFGGAADLSAASSYALDAQGALTTVSGSVPTTETAACWVAIEDGGRFAYTMNAGSNSITGFRIGHDGALARLDADGVTATADDGPLDAAFSDGGRFLYVLNGRSHSLTAYSRGGDGSLRPLPGLGGLPPAANGLAAR